MNKDYVSSTLLACFLISTISSFLLLFTAFNVSHCFIITSTTLINASSTYIRSLTDVLKNPTALFFAHSPPISLSTFFFYIFLSHLFLNTIKGKLSGFFGPDILKNFERQFSNILNELLFSYVKKQHFERSFVEVAA